MKKTARSDSQADAVAAVLLVVLVVAFAVVWVCRPVISTGRPAPGLTTTIRPHNEAGRKQNAGDDVGPGAVA